MVMEYFCPWSNSEQWCGWVIWLGQIIMSQRQNDISNQSVRFAKNGITPEELNTATDSTSYATIQKKRANNPLKKRVVETATGKEFSSIAEAVRETIYSRDQIHRDLTKRSKLQRFIYA